MNVTGFWFQLLNAFSSRHFEIHSLKQRVKGGSLLSVSCSRFCRAGFVILVILPCPYTVPINNRHISNIFILILIQIWNVRIWLRKIKEIANVGHGDGVNEIHIKAYKYTCSILLVSHNNISEAIQLVYRWYALVDLTNLSLSLFLSLSLSLSPSLSLSLSLTHTHTHKGIWFSNSTSWHQ